MALNTTQNRIVYAGNGATLDFSYPYYYLAKGHVKVVLVLSGGAEQAQSETTHYTLTAPSESGGTVSMLVAPAVGEQLVIYREVPLTQEFEPVEGGPLPAAELEKSVDKVVMITQQLQDQVSRSAVLSPATQLPNLRLPTPEATRLIGWNSLANGLANYSPGSEAENVFSALGQELCAKATVREMADFLGEAGTSPAMHGAAGDGVADDTSALQAAFNSGLFVRGGGPGKTYKISSSLSLPSGLRFDGEGCAIDASSLTGTAHAMVAAGSAGSGQAVSGSVSALDLSVTLVNTPSGIAAGDWVLLASSDVYPYVGYSVDKGEMLCVRSVDSGTKVVTFTTPILDSYSTSPVLMPVSWKRDIHLSNFKLTGSGSPTASDRGVCFRYVDGFSLKRATVDLFNAYNVEVQSSINGSVVDCDTHGVFYNGSTGTIFYGIVLLNACQYVNVVGNRGHRNRHLVVTTSASTGQGFWGQPTFCEIAGNIGWDAMSGGAGRSFMFECHGFGRFCHWHHNEANGGYSGFRIENGQDCVFESNIVRNYAYCGILIGGSGKGTIANLSVVGNLISGMTADIGAATDAAILVQSIDSGAGVYRNLRIDRNVIENPHNGSNYKSGIKLFANGYVNCSVSRNQILSSVDSTTYGINLATGVNRVVVSGNIIYGFRNGILLDGNRCVARDNVVGNDAAKATGFGFYSNGTKNIYQGNTAILLARLGSLAASSNTNLCVNNQSLECTTGTFADTGTANVLRDNDAI